MITFFIKSSFCIAIFYGLYWLILRKQKLFSFIRYYLIISILFSLIVPFLSIPFSIEYERASVFSEYLRDMPEPEPKSFETTPVKRELFQPDKDIQVEFNSAQENQAKDVKRNTDIRIVIFLLVYSVGFLIMLSRFMRNIVMLKNMLSESDKIDCDWYQIALLDRKISPFSFHRTVFFNKPDYTESRIGDNVLQHELEHVRQSHTFDIIFLEILHLVFWFNPVVFLYKKAAKINHEYMADEAVVSRNLNPVSYASELVSFVSHRYTAAFTSGFSPSMIKLRLLMLNTTTPLQKKISSITLTFFLSIILIGSLSMKPAYKDTGNLGKRYGGNKDIVIENIYLRDKNFNPNKSIVVLNGKELGPEDSMKLAVDEIKRVNLLTKRGAIRKYGRKAKNGVIEISTYNFDINSDPDTLHYKPLCTINDTVPSKGISIPVKDLYSISTWTYPQFPNQYKGKQWRLLEIVTRDYYKICGRVVQTNGEPLAGVVVSSTDNLSEVRSDDSGKFVLSDINPGSAILLSATGFEPRDFNITKELFKHQLSITLNRINEPDSDLIITNAGTKLKDFSGRWRLNKNLSQIKFPEGYEITCDIRQFDSDSTLMKTTTVHDDGRVSSHDETYVFNSVKSRMDKNKISRTLSSCKIAYDGQSFSIASSRKSIISGSGDSRIVEEYYLDKNGKQLIISEMFTAYSSERARPFPKMVFDKE